MPHITYSAQACPSVGCQCRFQGIDFCLEKIDPFLYKQGLLAWYQGLALIARCPGCGHLIAFSLDAIATGDTAPPGSVTLPADWHSHADFMDENGQLVNLIP